MHAKAFWHRHKTAILAGAALTLLVFCAYGRSLVQGFAPLDDDLLVAHNLAIRGMTPGHLQTVFTSYDPELYIPLTFVSYQINWMIAGLSPWIYHLTNLLLHSANACLVGLLLFKFTNKKWLSLLGAAIFAVHPLNAEAVVWIAGRKDLLSMFFFLLSFLSYIQHREGKKRAYTMSLVWFTLSLLAKVMTATLPVLLLLFDWLIDRRHRKKKHMFVDKLPYLTIALAMLLVGALGKERILGHQVLLETALVAAKSVAFYLQKFVWPFPLGVFYPYQGTIGVFVPAFLIPAIVIAALVACSIWMMHRWPWFTFGFFFFLVALSPTFINFHKGGEVYFASDRYPYMPQIGLIVIVVMALDWLWKHVTKKPFIATVSVGIPVVAALTILSLFQTMIWDSDFTLFSHTLTLYPESQAARVGLASMARSQGRYDEAFTLLDEGLTFGESARLRMSLGSLYAKVGDVEKAEDEFKKVRALDPMNPEPLVGLGVLDEYRKNIPKAMDEYRQAVTLDRSYVEARNKLASLLIEQKNLREAEEQLRLGLAWNPNAEGVLYNMSIVLDQTKRADEARALLEQAYELSPDNFSIALALAEHLVTADPRRARVIVTDLEKRDPRNPDVVSLQKALRE